MNGKTIQNRSSLSFCVPDGMIDVDHIMQLNAWKEADKFNTTEMNRIQDVLNEFNSMVLDRKHKDRRPKSEGKENVSASSNNASEKDELKASKLANRKSTRRSTDHIKNCEPSKDSDTGRVGEKASKIPRPRQTIGEKTEGTKSSQQNKEDKEKSGKSENKATKTSNNRTTGKRSSAKTGRKENIEANKLTVDPTKRTQKAEKKFWKQAQLPQGKGTETETGTGPTNFQEMPERKAMKEPPKISRKGERGRPPNCSSVENKKRRVQRRESMIVNEGQTVTVKQEHISMMEESNCDTTFDGNALANSTMSSHVPVSTMSSMSAARNTTSYSCIKKSAKRKTCVIETGAARAGTPQKILQIKQEKESPVTKKVDKTRKTSSVSPKKDKKVPTKKSSGDKPRAKTRRFDRSESKDNVEYTKRVKRHASGAKRAIEEFSHHVVSIAKEMGYLKDIDFSDEDSYSDFSDCSYSSNSSYSTHSEFCTCGDCTSCSSDEYSEYTLCSCSGCSCCDSASASASDHSEDDP